MMWLFYQQSSPDPSRMEAQVVFDRETIPRPPRLIRVFEIDAADRGLSLSHLTALVKYAPPAGGAVIEGTAVRAVEGMQS